MAAMRDLMLKVRLTEDERRMLDALAAADGVKLSDYVRLFIRKAHAEALKDKRLKK